MNSILTSVETYFNIFIVFDLTKFLVKIFLINYKLININKKGFLMDFYEKKNEDTELWLDFYVLSLYYKKKLLFEVGSLWENLKRKLVICVEKMKRKRRKGERCVEMGKEGRIEWRRTAHMSFMSAILLGYELNGFEATSILHHLHFPFTLSLTPPQRTHTYPKLKKLWIWRPFLFLTFQPFPFSSSLQNTIHLLQFSHPLHHTTFHITP